MSYRDGLDPVAIGGRVKQRRELLGFAQRDCPVDGVGYAYVSRIEAGQRTPSLSALIGLADWLHVTPEWLVYGDELPSPCVFCGRPRRG